MDKQAPIRNLTDADVEKVAEVLEARLTRQFVHNVGKGVLALAWRGVVVGVIALSVYGYMKGIK